MAILSGSRLAPARINPVILRVRQTAAQTIATGTWALLTFGAEDIDTHGTHSGTSSNFTCPTGGDGTYDLTGGVSWAASATGQRWSRWYKNGVEIDGSGANMNACATGLTFTVARPITVQLVAGDFVGLAAFHTAGANLDTYVTLAYGQSSMSVERRTA